MERIWSQQANVGVGGRVDFTASLERLSANKTCSKLYLVFNGTLTLPVIAAGDLEPEHLSQCWSNIQLQYGPGDIQTTGASLSRYWRARGYNREQQNRTYPDNAATVIQHWLPIPLNPLMSTMLSKEQRRAARIHRDELAGQAIRFTFDVGALGADITSAVGQFEVWADSQEKRGVDGIAPLFTYMSRNDNETDSLVRFGRADLVIFENTNAFAELRVDEVSLTDMTPAQYAQALEWEYSDEYRYNEVRTSVVDPALMTFPLYVGGARTTPQLLKAFDRRNFKSSNPGCLIRLTNRNANPLPVAVEYAVER
jgi:hypothetical protein